MQTLLRLHKACETKCDLSCKLLWTEERQCKWWCTLILSSQSALLPPPRRLGLGSRVNDWNEWPWWILFLQKVFWIDLKIFFSSLFCLFCLIAIVIQIHQFKKDDWKSKTSETQMRQIGWSWRFRWWSQPPCHKHWTQDWSTETPWWCDCCWCRLRDRQWTTIGEIEIDPLNGKWNMPPR